MQVICNTITPTCINDIPHILAHAGNPRNHKCALQLDLASYNLVSIDFVSATMYLLKMSYKIATFALTIIIIIASVHKKASGAQITGKTNFLCKL